MQQSAASRAPAPAVGRVADALHFGGETFLNGLALDGHEDVTRGKPRARVGAEHRDFAIHPIQLDGR